MNYAKLEKKIEKRFAFGRNWIRFLSSINQERIYQAEFSLQKMLGFEHFRGLSFLDAGCGSGLFSLAASRLGAAVHSFDYDPDSVAAALELRRRFFQAESKWTIERGSVLDKAYLNKLGQFDIVYSWGVLHHTGAMWQAMDNLVPLVSNNGYLFISIYNDQGAISQFWLKIKKTYNSGCIGRMTLVPLFCFVFSISAFLKDAARGTNPILRYTQYRRKRGMSLIHDWIDFIGGYPYETAKPQDIFAFYLNHGFVVRKTVYRQSLGCNEFVFQKANPP